jgi:CHAT domain-containing protein/tetratricopeptide (TPR) repeat protein
LPVARICALLLAGLAICGCSRPAGFQRAATPAPRPAGGPAAKTPLPPRNLRPCPLTPGSGTPQELDGEHLDRYEIELARDQYLDATFDQQGVDLVVEVYAPGGERLFQIDSPNRAQGPESVHWVAETAGRYRLEVSTDRGNPPGLYVPSLRAPRTPTARERSQAAADRVFYEAREIKDQPNRFWEASAKYAQSVFLFEEAGDRWHQAYALLQLGKLRQGQPREALGLLTRSERLFRELGDRRFLIQALNQIGTCQTNLADFDRASDAYQAALAVARQIAEVRDEATILHNLGYLHQVNGRSWQALGFFRSSLALRQREAGPDARAEEANTLTGIGWVYQSTGDLPRAIDAHWRALKLRNHLRDRHAQSISLTQIGANWLSIDPHHALPYLEKARELQKDLQNLKDEATTQESLGVAYRLLLRLDEAQAAYLRALDIFRSLRDLDSQAVTVTSLGWLAVHLEQPEEALRRFGQGLELARQTRNPEREAAALQGMAAAERLRGNPALAQLRAESSLAIVESLRATILRRDLQASYLAANSSAYGVLIGALMDRHRQTPTGGFDRLAWYHSEQARARTLLDALRESRQQRVDLLRADVPPAWIDQRRDLLRKIAAEDARRRSPLAGTAEKTLAEQTLSELLDRLNEVDARIREARGGQVPGGPLPAASVEDLRRHFLDRNDLLLEISLGTTRSYLWAVSADGLQSFELPGTDVLAPLLRSACEQLASPAAAGDARLLELSRLLLGPVARQLGERRLLIAADGLAQYLPFAALPDPTGRHEPLILHHEIVSVPSLRVLAELRERAAERKISPEKLLAVVGDAVFDSTDERVAAVRARQPYPAGEGEDPFLPRLAFARDEATALAALVPTGQRFQALDFAASRELVTGGHLAGYKILHFATHALQSTDPAELSALVLSRFDAQGHPVDGYLRVADLEGLDLASDLVVLSACDTALGGQVRGEELAPLPQAFLIAGARRVLASLWQVEDESTAVLMEQFYRRLLIRHLPPAQALREAQLAVRAQPQWRSPRYWAGFVLLGDWR